MAKFSINGNYNVDSGTGNFQKSISCSDCQIEVSYDELKNCNTQLHLAIVSGFVDIGVQYQTLGEANNFRLIAFYTYKEPAKYKLNGKFVTELVYQKYQIYKDTQKTDRYTLSVPNDYFFCDVYIFADKLGKFYINNLEYYSYNIGINLIENINLQNTNIFSSDCNFIVISYPSKFKPTT